MATDTRITARLENDLIDQVRRETGLTTAPLSQLIRAGLLALLGRDDPLCEAAMRPGPKPKTPRT